MVVLFFHASVNAQIINGSFETWNTTPFSNPNGWSTGNQDGLEKNGSIPVTQVQGFSGAAVRMETMVNGTDTSFAYISNGDPLSGEGGVPCWVQPDSISGYYRCNIPAQDTALLIVIFKYHGNVIDNYTFRFTGIQNTFIPFKFYMNVFWVPDTVIIAATSSNIINGTGVEDGSFLELDGLQFPGTVVPIPNGSFETWNPETFDIASGWDRYGEVVKTTDGYMGSNAIKLTTIDYGNGDIRPAGITNGKNNDFGSPTGGSYYTSMNDTLTGFYKLTTTANDTAMVNVTLFNNSNPVFINSVYLPQTVNYTYFEIPLTSFMTPDTMLIEAISSKWPYSPASSGTSLLIDHLRMKSTITTSINKQENELEMIVYPNPAKESIYIKLNENLSGNCQLSIHDISGRLVSQHNVTDPGMELQLNIENLLQGVYHLSIISDNTAYKKSFAKSE
jgi:hypothetical protein